MKTVAIIQAHMGSTRLPGKVLKDVCGLPMLTRVIKRTEAARTLDMVAVACAKGPADDPIVAECARLAVPVFRGSDGDVLDRYYHAAVQFGAKAVVRITSDCPFIDPDVVDDVVKEFRKTGAQYASNTLHRTYPRGLDTEVCTIEALTTAWEEAKTSYQRVHVTPYFYENPQRFSLQNVGLPQEDYSSHRWTVDTPEDLEFVRAIYRNLDGAIHVSWRDVLTLLTRAPELLDINREIRQKSLHEG